MLKPMLHCSIIQSQDTYNIRKKVLWPHIKNGNYALPIDTSIDTFHLGTFFNKKIISIGTFTKNINTKFKYNKQYRLRAMATDNQYRFMGGGKVLFLEALKILKKKKIELLWCDARINAIPFYESLNMNSLDSVYEIVNIGPHKTMYINIQ